MMSLPPTQPDLPNVLLVTGLSGAGLSSALKCLEDEGYEVFDNFPLALLDALLAQSDPENTPIAIGFDSRNRSFDAAGVAKVLDSLRALPAAHYRPFLLCLVAEDEALQRRFTETRRRHPLALDDRPLLDGIQSERLAMAPLVERADLVIDTTALKLPDLQKLIRAHFRPDDILPLSISVMSFAFRNGLPREADLVFDVRFLRNPHWVEGLKDKTGQASDVADYVRADPTFADFWAHLTGMLGISLPRYQDEGKHYLTIAIGCSGGKHRSVALAEHLQGWLAAQGYPARVTHRDMPI